jgi:hypothetical protein
MSIRWKEMVPWYPGYFISDSGEMLGRRGRPISPQIAFNGGIRYGVLDGEGKVKLVRASRMVCWFFNGPYPNDGSVYQAWHKDSDLSNNNYRNLEWRRPPQRQERREVTISASELSAAYLGQIPGMSGIWAFRRHVFDRDKLGKIMRERGISGSKLSAISGASPPSISEWLTGKKVPGPKNILVLAVALDADVSDFLTFASSGSSRLSR